MLPREAVDADSRPSIREEYISGRPDRGLGEKAEVSMKTNCQARAGEAVPGVTQGDEEGQVSPLSSRLC